MVVFDDLLQLSDRWSIIIVCDGHYKIGEIFLQVISFVE